MTPQEAINLLNKIDDSGDWPMASFVLRDLLESLGYTHVVSAYDKATTHEKPKKRSTKKAPTD